MEKSKGIERKTDKCRDREMQCLDTEEGNKSARDRHDIRETQMPGDTKNKRKPGSEAEGGGGWEQKSDLDRCHKPFPAF